MTRGYDTLATAAQQMERSIVHTLSFHQSLRVENWPQSNDLVLQDMLNQINDWVKTDPMQEAKRRLGHAVGEPFKLMEQHPVFSGLWLYNLKILYQEIGVTFVGAWGSVIYAGPLYNAVRQEKLLKTQWEDMELVMMLHDTFFISNRPNTPEDYLKRFALGMGLSALELAKNKRSGGGQLGQSKRGPKGLTELAPVAQMFKDCYCHSAGRSDLTTEDLEKILSQGMWEEEEDKSKAASKDRGIVRVYAQNKPTEREQLQRCHCLTTPQQLLQALQNSLHGEALELTSNYLLLHKMCWLVQHFANDHCCDRLNNMLRPMYIEEENQLPFIVGYIFLAAVNADRLGGILVKKKQAVVTSALLVEAANILNGIL